MRNVVFAVVILLTTASQAGDTVTSYSVRFGNGCLTRRSDGSKILIQQFGSGTLQRESFRSGRSAIHTSTPFGHGVLIRSSGSYVRKP